MSRRDIYWILVFSVIYLGTLGMALFYFHLSLSDMLPVIAVFGVMLPSIAYLFFRKVRASLADKPVLKNEGLLLLLLIGWLVFYITYGSGFINKLIPGELLRNDRLNFFIIIFKKLLVFVVAPFLIYRSLGFHGADFGFRIALRKIFSSINIRTFIVISTCILAFEYFFSGGAETLRAGNIKFFQLLFAVPLTFLWMMIEAGLVEEFFFRALLQSRIAVLFKSEYAGIFLGVLVFALAHAPGLYLRGSASEGIGQPMSPGFWVVYCIVNMSTAGIFLGITWSRTKNLYMVMALHAMTDLLPNLNDFIRTWHI